MRAPEPVWWPDIALTIPKLSPDSLSEIWAGKPYEVLARYDSTGDFATIVVDYIPDLACVELKSMTLYMRSYRNEGAFHEAVTTGILDDLVAATAPRFMRITAKWYVRGGIFTNVIAEHRKPGWTPAPRVDLPTHDSASPMAADVVPAKAGTQ